MSSHFDLHERADLGPRLSWHASQLASLAAFQHTWIARAEYDMFGPSAIHSRCFCSSMGSFEVDLLLCLFGFYSIAFVAMFVFCFCFMSFYRCVVISQ
jgi:hypothetical protein